MSAHNWQAMQADDEESRGFASALHRVEYGMAGQQEADVISDYVDRLWLKLESEEMKNGN